MSDVAETPAVVVAVVDVDDAVGRANFPVTAVAADTADNATDDGNDDVAVLFAMFTDFRTSGNVINILQLLARVLDRYELEVLVLLIAVVFADAFVLLLMAIFMRFGALLILDSVFIVCSPLFCRRIYYFTVNF